MQFIIGTRLKFIENRKILLQIGKILTLFIYKKLFRSKQVISCPRKTNKIAYKDIDNPDY